MTKSDARAQVAAEESWDSMEGLTAVPASAASGFFASLPGARLVRAVWPGFLTAATIALAASWLSQHYGAPVMLFALLIGMAFHFLHEGGRCVSGIEFSARTVLRLGVALLGVRVTLGEIASLGIHPVLTVVVGVMTTIGIGVLAARALGLRPWFGLLSGGSVAICGASAALAVASVLPDRARNDGDTILTVVSVTALSTVAMVLYPVLVAAVGFDHAQAGVFLGGTIHDVAQVVGAGYMVSSETGDVATYVKLLRVAMLLPVVFAIGVFVARQSGKDKGRTPPLPTFLVGFAGLMLVNSAGLIPQAGVAAIGELSRWCLVIAIAALGMKTSFKAVFAVGWRPIALMVIETAWIAALVFGSVVLWG